jgi:ElaB/YqjD/DUF883 family membrane-anchored ribosome-binding protein
MLASGEACKDVQPQTLPACLTGPALQQEDPTMSTPSNADRKSLDDAAEVANEAASKVAGKISSKLDEAARSASRFSDKLRSNGAALQEELSAASERFGDGAKRLGAVTSDQIRTHPLAAVGIAVAVGYVAARLLRRR